MTSKSQFELCERAVYADRSRFLSLSCAKNADRSFVRCVSIPALADAAIEQCQKKEKRGSWLCEQQKTHKKKLSSEMIRTKNTRRWTSLSKKQRIVCEVLSRQRVRATNVTYRRFSHHVENAEALNYNKRHERAPSFQSHSEYRRV